MAFPAIESASPAADNITGGAATTGDIAAASHSVVLPATVSAGALLLVVGRVTVAGTITITESGWTLVQDNSDASIADQYSFWAYRNTLAAGTEDGSTITVNHHSSGKLAAIAISVTGAASPATQAPETALGIGTGSTIDGPNLTPTGGAKDYLWLAAYLSDYESTIPKTPPTGYTHRPEATTGTVAVPTGNAQVMVSDRQLNAASENPGAVTVSQIPSGWTAWTLAIHPAAAAAPPANTVAPAVTGTPVNGQTLTCSTGTWSNSPTGYAYQWKRGGTAISGATSSTYTLVTADKGTSVKCTVTATNADGSASTDSNAVSVSSTLDALPATGAVLIRTSTGWITLT